MLEKYITVLLAKVSKLLLSAYILLLNFIHILSPNKLKDKMYIASLLLPILFSLLVNASTSASAGSQPSGTLSSPYLHNASYGLSDGTHSGSGSASQSGSACANIKLAPEDEASDGGSLEGAKGNGTYAAGATGTLATAVRNPLKTGS